VEPVAVVERWLVVVELFAELFALDHQLQERFAAVV